MATDLPSLKKQRVSLCLKGKHLVGKPTLKSKLLSSVQKTEAKPLCRLSKIVILAVVSSHLSSLTMTESSSDKENVPPAKKRKLSLSLTKWHHFIQTSSKELSTLEKAQVPKNTEVSSRLALKNLHDWYTDYQERNPESPCPESILTSSPNKEDLNKYLTIFISETGNQNGERYPPRTIYSLLSGILRATRTENPAYPNFLDRKDLAFKTFHIDLDNLFKKVKLDGIGVDSKHTENISAVEEDALWASGVLNVSTPKSLLRVFFFYLWKVFLLPRRSRT